MYGYVQPVQKMNLMWRVVKMKCVKKGEQIKRVSDSQAIELVEKHNWNYCPKHEWKTKYKSSVGE